MKKDKIIFWIATGLIFVFEGVMPALTGHTEMAKQGVSHLGFPDYFRVELAIAKFIAAISLWLPVRLLKEAAYIGLAISFISAIIAHIAMNDSIGHIIYPVFVLAILIISYRSYKKIATN